MSIIDFVAPGAGRTEIHLLELTSPTTLVSRETLESNEGCNGSFVDEGVWLTHAAPSSFSGDCELALRDLTTMDVVISRPLEAQAKLLAFEYPIAVVAFEKRIEFVDVTTLSTLSSFELPKAGFARFEDDIVYIHHEGGVTLISPPCGL